MGIRSSKNRYERDSQLFVYCTNCTVPRDVSAPASTQVSVYVDGRLHVFNVWTGRCRICTNLVQGFAVVPAKLGRDRLCVSCQSQILPRKKTAEDVTPPPVPPHRSPVPLAPT